MPCRPETRFPAALLAALLALPAFAADLGDTRVLSHVGQPLNAEIDLTGVTAAEAGRLAVRAASADLYLQANIKPDPALSSLKFEVEQRNGQAVVRATSGKPITAPYLHVFLEVPSGSGYAVRALTFWLTPAPAGAAVAQEEAPKAKPRPAKAKPQVADVAKAAEAGAVPAAQAAAAVAHAVPASAQWGKPGPAPAVIAAAAAAKAASAPAVVRTAAPAEAGANGQAVPAHGAPAAAGALPAHAAPAAHAAPGGAGTASTHGAPPGAGVTSTHGAPPGPGVTSTHGAPSGPGVTSTRPAAAAADAGTVSTPGAHAPAPAKEAPVHGKAAAPAADHAVPAALPAACPAPKQLRAQLQQCVAAQADNLRINTQIDVLEQKVDTLRQAVKAPAPVKPLKTKNPNAWIWSIGVPAVIAALAMAGAAWFAGRRQGRRAGDKRPGKRKAEPAAEAAEQESEEDTEQERAAVKGMIAKARAALRKMRAGKAKAADAALPEPETATQEG